MPPLGGSARVGQRSDRRASPWCRRARLPRAVPGASRWPRSPRRRSICATGSQAALARTASRDGTELWEAHDVGPGRCAPWETCRRARGIGLARRAVPGRALAQWLVQLLGQQARMLVLGHAKRRIALLVRALNVLEPSRSGDVSWVELQQLANDACVFLSRLPGPARPVCFEWRRPSAGSPSGGWDVLGIEGDADPGQGSRPGLESKRLESRLDSIRGVSTSLICSAVSVVAMSVLSRCDGWWYRGRA